MRVWIITKRTLVAAVAILVLAALAVVLVLTLQEKEEEPSLTTGAAAGALETYELDVPAGRQRALPVYSVQREDKKIALTIDAAWEDDKTPFILEELARQEIKATFYLCGFWVEKYPDNVRAIAEAGHELGNHSATHPHMNGLSASQLRKEIEDVETMLAKITGERTKTFRAPYGEYNDTVINTINSMGYPVIQWSIDTVDWREERSAQTILDTVLPKLAPGCIILCHNNGFKIKEYLPTLISTAKEQGYEFVTVSELLLEGETIIDVNGVQKPLLPAE